MKEKYAELLTQLLESDEYWIEVVLQDFTAELERALQESGTTRADLARGLNCAPAYVTRLLRGNANMTLTTVARIGKALELVPRIHLAKHGTATYWLDEPQERIADFAVGPEKTTVSGKVSWQPGRHIPTITPEVAF